MLNFIRCSWHSKQCCCFFGEIQLQASKTIAVLHLNEFAVNDCKFGVQWTSSLRAFISCLICWNWSWLSKDITNKSVFASKFCYYGGFLLFLTFWSNVEWCGWAIMAKFGHVSNLIICFLLATIFSEKVHGMATLWGSKHANLAPALLPAHVASASIFDWIALKTNQLKFEIVKWTEGVS